MGSEKATITKAAKITGWVRPLEDFDPFNNWDHYHALIEALRCRGLVVRHCWHHATNTPGASVGSGPIFYACSQRRAVTFAAVAAIEGSNPTTGAGRGCE